MATRSRVHLHHRRARGADALPVICGGLITLDDKETELRLQIADGALQQCGLSGPRRADKIKGQDLPTCKPGTVPCGQGIVLGKDASLQLDDGRNVMQMAMTSVMIMMRCMPMMGAVGVHVVMVMVMVMVMIVVVHMGVPASVGMRVIVMMGWFCRVIIHHGLLPGLEIDDGRASGISASAVSAHQAVSSSSMVLIFSSSP